MTYEQFPSKTGKIRSECFIEPLVKAVGITRCTYYTPRSVKIVGVSNV